jgi:hypothetical protein
MPPGFSPADLLYLLPEIALSIGAVAVLLLDLVLRRPLRHDPDRPGRADQVLAGVTLAALAVTGAALVPTVGLHTTAARGLMAWMPLPCSSTCCCWRRPR